MRSIFYQPRRRPRRAVEARGLKVAEATPEQIAASGAAAGSWGLDPIDGDTGWSPVSQNGREIPAFTVEKARTNSVASYRVNPMARAIIETYIAFCVGDVGVGFMCSNAEVEDVVREFWEDPANDMAGQQELMLRDLLLMGELGLELMTGENTGVVRISPILVSEITAVTLIKRNPMWPDQLWFQVGGEQLRAPLTVVRVSDESDLREGDVLWCRPWRALTSDVRSAPFMMPILDWLDSYDTVLSNLIDRTSLSRYLVWDVTIQGDQNAVNNFITSRGGTSIPRSGTIEVHNESVTWEAKTVSTGADEDNSANQSVLTMVAGGTGLQKTWLAEPDGANRATSQSMAEPVRRRVASVQKVWLNYMRDLLRYVVDQAVAAGRLPSTITSYDEKTGQERKIKSSLAVNVTGPEIAASDSQITAQVLLNLSTGLQNLVNTGALTPKAARAAARKAWEDYAGVPYTSDLDEPDPQDQAEQAVSPDEHVDGQPVKPPGANGQNVPGLSTGKGKNVEVEK